jgi:hypothetical protein
LQKIEAWLRREQELDKLDPKVVQALARAVLRFVPADEDAQLRRATLAGAACECRSMLVRTRYRDCVPRLLQAR